MAFHWRVDDGDIGSSIPSSTKKINKVIKFGSPLTKLSGSAHETQFNTQVIVMLGLHYVPGSHGSHGSQKRSSPWCFSHFCLCFQVLLSLATFSHGLSRSAVTEARRRATVCHGWFYVCPRPATFCWDLSRFVTLRSSSATSIKFCQGFLR